MHVDLTCFVNDYSTHSEAFLRQLFQGLSRKYRLEIICLKGKTSFSEQNLIIRKVIRPWSLLFLLQLPILLVELKEIDFRNAYRLFVLRQARSTKIYFPFISMTNMFSDVLHLSRNKIFVSVRGTDVTITPFLKKGIEEVYKKCAQSYYAIHFLSEELQEVSHLLGIECSRESIVYQGVNFSRFSFNNRISNDKLRLITVGRFHYVKGLEYVLLLCYYLAKNGTDFHLTIVTGGSEIDRLKYMIHTFGLEAYITTQENLDHQDLAELYRSHNVYVHTHLVNGVSNTMLEALASNLRVLTFNSNLKRYANDGLIQVIYEVPKGDILQMKSVLEQWSAEGSYGLSENLVKEVLFPFSLDNHVKKFETFFELA